MKLFNIDVFEKDFIEVKVKKQYKRFLNIEISFDIETSSFYDDDLEETSIIYSYCFAIRDQIFRFRTRKEFDNFYKSLLFFLKSNNAFCIIYVHNLSYEFQFIKKILNFDEDLLGYESVREIIMSSTDNFTIQFRCSLKLSRMNLEKLSEQTTTKKLVGDLDYELIRHENTLLTDEEIAYIENDVLIINEYIANKKKLYDNNIYNIPLTSTGEVRKHIKEIYFKSSEWKSLMKTIKLTLKEYQQLVKAFSGGYTHANSRFVNKTLENVYSVDLSSSYPSSMIKFKYPMRKKCYHHKLDQKSLENIIYKHQDLCVFTIKLKEVECLYDFPILSDSKCISINQLLDNGRIVQADEIETTITSVDYISLKKIYNFKVIKVSKVYVYYKDYLPKAFLEEILELYAKKTTLKDVENKEEEYAISKAYLNSLYGMCVSAIIRSVLKYDKKQKLVYLEKCYDEEDKIKEENENQQKFLSYTWGVFITAYSRMMLYNALLLVNKDYVYCDTDSVKFFNDKHFETFKKLDSINNEWIRKSCVVNDLDVEKTKPCDIKGVVHELGVWSVENSYKKFKTLGAKRYMYIDEKDKKGITVAGLSKNFGAKYIFSQEEPFNFFTNNMYIDKEFTNKNSKIYIDHFKKGIVRDYKGENFEYSQESGVFLGKTDFTLRLSDQYLLYLNR